MRTIFLGKKGRDLPCGWVCHTKTACRLFLLIHEVTGALHQHFIECRHIVFCHAKAGHAYWPHWSCRIRSQRPSPPFSAYLSFPNVAERSHHLLLLHNNAPGFWAHAIIECFISGMNTGSNMHRDGRGSRRIRQNHARSEGICSGRPSDFFQIVLLHNPAL